VFGKDERVDWRNNDVFVAMDDKRGMSDIL
jgi:hypothetical protein